MCRAQCPTVWDVSVTKTDRDPCFRGGDCVTNLGGGNSMEGFTVLKQ